MDEPRGPRIPDSASDDIEVIIGGDTPGNNEACIINPFAGREYLTRFEALDAINMLTGMLMADERFRGNMTGQEDSEDGT